MLVLVLHFDWIGFSQNGSETTVVAISKLKFVLP